MHDITKDPRWADAIAAISAFALGVFDSECQHHDGVAMVTLLSDEQVERARVMIRRHTVDMTRGFAKIRHGAIKVAWLRNSRAAKRKSRGSARKKK